MTQNLVGTDPDDDAQLNYDPETLERRMKIFDKINKRKKQDYQGTTANKQAHYSNVVNEFVM